MSPKPSSGPVQGADPSIGFGRVHVLKPYRVGEPPQVVRSLFTALVPIVADRPEIRTIAMPIIATGNMGYSIDQMLPPLVGAAVDALSHGLPIDRIAIVVRSDTDAIAASRVFAATHARVGEYDVFISYAHEDTHAREQFVEALLARRPDAKVFVTASKSTSERRGSARSSSLDRCRRIITLLSPAYLKSDVCLEEFNIAWMRSRDAKEQILRPLFISGHELPTYMPMAACLSTAGRSMPRSWQVRQRAWRATFAEPVAVVGAPGRQGRPLGSDPRSHQE